MINPASLRAFESEAEQYEPIKNDVKEWIENNYEPAKTKQISIYQFKHKFEREVGYVTHGALTVWLTEWGYEVAPSVKNLEGTYNHVVYAKQRRRFMKTKQFKA